MGSWPSAGPKYHSILLSLCNLANECFMRYYQRPCTIRLSPKREIALSAVPWYWESELMLLPSIKYDFTILRRVIMTLILLKTIHTSHKKNQKNKY